jgi:predicted nuclease of predicted toxin-antitoxin system
LTLRALALLADENIHPDVVRYLREEGCDVVTVHQLDLAGASDEAILATSLVEARVVLTHDSDFGALAMAGGQSVVGIIYIRPGHIRAEFTIATLRSLFDRSLDVTPPFLLVAIRRNDTVRVRVRRLRTISSQ